MLFVYQTSDKLASNIIQWLCRKKYNNQFWQWTVDNIFRELSLAKRELRLVFATLNGNTCISHLHFVKILEILCLFRCAVDFLKKMLSNCSIALEKNMYAHTTHTHPSLVNLCTAIVSRDHFTFLTVNWCELNPVESTQQSCWAFQWFGNRRRSDSVDIWNKKNVYVVIKLCLFCKSDSEIPVWCRPRLINSLTTLITVLRWVHTVLLFNPMSDTTVANSCSGHRQSLLVLWKCFPPSPRSGTKSQIMYVGQCDMALKNCVELSFSFFFVPSLFKQTLPVRWKCFQLATFSAMLHWGAGARQCFAAWKATWLNNNGHCSPPELLTKLLPPNSGIYSICVYAGGVNLPLAPGVMFCSLPDQVRRA